MPSDQSPDDTEWTWRNVERLISDLKSDGYHPTDLDTSTSHAAPTKTIFLDVERSAPSTTDTDRSEEVAADAE